MQTWQLQAILSAIFAGITAVLAKYGLENISADVSLAIRTSFVLIFVILNAFVWKSSGGIQQIGLRQIGFLLLSAVTTALSWIYYYRAMKDGQVSTVALIDKGSIVVTIVISVLFLREPLTWRLAGGGALVVAGLLVLVKR